MGKNHGLQRGMTMDVYRKIIKFDPYAINKEYHLNIKLGKLNIIYLEEFVAIGRKIKFSDQKDLPYLNIFNFMIGDTIRMSMK